MYLVGIAGSSGAGKTAVARELASLLPQAGIVCMDSYYSDRSDLPKAERNALNFDAPDALDWEFLSRHLQGLRQGGRISVPHYDFATHSRTDVVHDAGPWQVAILEGLFALWHPEIRSWLDLAVFIDVAADVCLARRIARDAASRGRTEGSVREQWRRDVAPMFRAHALPTRDQADLIVDGTRPPAESAREIRAALARTQSARGGPSLNSNR